MSALVILCALAVWGGMHSMLAAEAVKKKLALRVAGRDFYRLAYNVFSVVSFAPILWLAAVLPDRLLYEVGQPWRMVMRGGQGLAVALLGVAFMQTGALAFIGVRQVLNPGEKGGLVVRGLYRLVRHPLYTFSLLALWLNPVMSVNNLTLYLGATAYIWIGAQLEERKLLREFGEAYAAYRAVTPMLIPRGWGKQ